VGDPGSLMLEYHQPKFFQPSDKKNIIFNAQTKSKKMKYIRVMSYNSIFIFNQQKE
jgi:hypothetical protein